MMNSSAGAIRISTLAFAALLVSPFSAPATLADDVFDFPSDASSVIGSLGFIDADEIGFFWTAARGDLVSESFDSSCSRIDATNLDMDVVTNVLNSGAFVDWDVEINGNVVDSFTIPQGFTGPFSVNSVFPPIDGPVYDVTLRVTNVVAGGQGSHTFAYYNSGVPNGFDHSIELVCAGIEVSIDIKFCSDPNAFNCKKSGVLPVTIFGTDDFDVTDIDVSTLQLCTEDLSVCTGAPRDYSFADRGNPLSDIGAAQCAIVDGVEQDYLTQDGLLDLDAAFEADEVKFVLGDFCDLDKGSVSEPFVVTGTTWDGTTIFSVPFPNAGVDQLLKVNK